MPATTECNPGPRPPFIPAPNCAKAVMRYALFGQTIENVLHFSKPEPFDLPALEALTNTLEAGWITYFAPLLPGSVTLVDIVATALDVDTGPQWTKLCDQVGTNIGAAFPDPGATFAIKFATDKIGRSYRGRMYWPCLQNTAVTAGTVSGSYANALTAAISSVIGLVNIEVGANHCVLSYQHKCVWRVSGVPTTVVAYTYSDLNIDSQRRRLPGRGI